MQVIDTLETVMQNSIAINSMMDPLVVRTPRLVTPATLEQFPQEPEDLRPHADITLEPWDFWTSRWFFDQDVAASLGLWSVGAGAAAGVLLGVFADRFRRRYKLLIMVMFVAAAAGFLVFCLICQGIVPRTSAALYGSVIVGVAAMSATNPLFLELAVETLFPVGEGLVSMSLIMAPWVTAPTAPCKARNQVAPSWISTASCSFSLVLDGNINLCKHLPLKH